MPSKRWSKQFFASFFPQVSFSDEFLNLVVVRYGQQPSNLTSICQYLLASKTEMLESNSNATKVDEKKLMRKITDFALKLPKATKFFTATVPDVTWEDLGGLDTIKQLLIEMIVWPLEKPQVFHRMGISPPSGMLLHGPPGTGKTMLAKAAARASGCNFLNLSASDLMKAEFGESEKAIANAFDAARALSPCMIFIDEFQSLFGSRSTAGVVS
jgi:SpoVK/Ycf46/Vps4 family AAA+-type ATPase